MNLKKYFTFRNILIGLIVIFICFVAYFIRSLYKDKDSYGYNEKLEDNMAIKVGEEIEIQDNMIVKIGEKDFKLKLYDNNATKELTKMLPLIINMKDLYNNEKYYYLNKSLPISPERVKAIKSGDLMLFGSDCLVIFYEDFTTSYSYTPIGYIEEVEGLKEALGNGSVEIKIST